MPGTDRVQGVGFAEKFVQPYTKSGIGTLAPVEEEIVWPAMGEDRRAEPLGQEIKKGDDQRSVISSLVSEYSSMLGMLGIDLSPFRNGTYTKNDIDRLYEKLFPHKERIPPEVWTQIENIKMGF